MRKTNIKYLLIFLISFLSVYLISFINISPGSDLPLYITLIFMGIIFTSGYVSIKSVRNIRKSISGNIAKIINKVYLTNITILSLLSILALELFVKIGILQIYPTINPILSAIKFASVILYFYITWDIVKDLRQLPKIYDTKTKKSEIED